MLDKVASAARTRVAARAHKELQRRKNALETSSLPAKLADCRSDDVDRTELFIVEGDSALGTAKLARNSEFQALLPIRGKILNVQKASPADMLTQHRVRLDHPGHRRRLRAHVRPRVGPLRQDHPDDRRRRRRRAHPHPAAHPDLPRHAPAARGGPRVRSRAAAAPDRGHRRAGQEERVHLHVLGRAAAPDPRRPGEEGPPGQGRPAAVQGARRDGRRPAARDHHGPQAPDPAPGAAVGRSGRRVDVRAAHGRRGRAAQGVHRRGRRRSDRSRIDA